MYILYVESDTCQQQTWYFGAKQNRPDVVHIYDYDVRIIAIMLGWISKPFSFSHTGYAFQIGFIAHHTQFSLEWIHGYLLKIQQTIANWMTKNNNFNKSIWGVHDLLVDFIPVILISKLKQRNSAYITTFSQFTVFTPSWKMLCQPKTDASQLPRKLIIHRS